MTEKDTNPTILQFDTSALIPAIVRDKDNCEVLLMAWMNWPKLSFAANV